MIAAALPRTTLPERFFAVNDPATLDRVVDGFEWCAIFKAGTGDRTFDAWLLVQQALEPRVDVAVGLVQIPAGRAASDRAAARSGIEHKSPQLLIFHRGVVVAHLDERAIAAEPLGALLAEHLPSAIGPRVVNEEAVSLGGFRHLLSSFADGTLPEERFQWAYLERLAKEAAWRDDETFALLNGLFENPGHRDVHPARLIALEFQGQLGGRLAPLAGRARDLLERLRVRS